MQDLKVHGTKWTGNCYTVLSAPIYLTHLKQFGIHSSKCTICVELSIIFSW